MKRHPREVKLVDSNGDQIGEDTYVDMFPFCYLDGKHALVSPSDLEIIDGNGKILDDEFPDVVRDIRPDWEGDKWVEIDVEVR